MSVNTYVRICMCIVQQCGGYTIATHMEDFRLWVLLVYVLLESYAEMGLASNLFFILAFVILHGKK